MNNWGIGKKWMPSIDYKKARSYEANSFSVKWVFYFKGLSHVELTSSISQETASFW